MSRNTKPVCWLIQENSINRAEFELLATACRTAAVPMHTLEVIPFSAELPPVSNDFNYILYGSITLSRLAANHPQLRKGVFFDEAVFSMENYLARWGPHMLNEGAIVTTLAGLVQQSYEEDHLLFIRPDHDNKTFAGELKTFGAIKKWVKELEAVGPGELTPQEKIIVAAPMQLAAEWRCWIVNKKVIAASRYRENFRLSKQAGCPPEVKDYAEARCQEYTPHDVFVMDICRCGDSYYILECGSMNAAGFYHADVTAVVQHVTDYFISVPG